MTEPTRYTAVGSGVVKTDPDGMLIAYGHYIELKAEVERLTADNEQLQNRCDFLEGKPSA